ncbi:MAG: hypothetical protein JNM39_02495 [Bdellovibrionaceae bacterium]|nr:hypothetical protein [Pseudobdellovibrionaceae bacterium]
MLKLCLTLSLCFCFLFLHQGQAQEPLKDSLSTRPEIQEMLQTLAPPTDDPKCIPPNGPQAPEESPKSLFKERQELEDYIECFFGPEKPNNYTKLLTVDGKALKKNTSHTDSKAMSIQDQVEMSAKAFDLPPAFLACSYLKESGLNPKVESVRDCVGIAQINEVTSKQIDKIIGGDLEEMPKGNKRSKYRKTRQEYQEILDREIPPETQLNKWEIARLKAQRTHASVMLAHHELAVSWKKYFTDRNLAVPPRFDMTMVKNPTFAIPAGALYFKYLALQLRQSLPDDASKVSQRPDTIQILAAQSNWGPGSVRRLAQNRRSESGPIKSADELLDLLFKRGPNETKNHMSAIKTCMEAGNSSRMMKRGPREKPKACYGEP